MGPILILDKSALQSLSLDESVWLDMFFGGNITPLLYVETLADLTKTDKRGRTGEQIVADIAHKTPVHGSFPNIHHLTLVANNLLGRTIEMTNRPIVAGGQPKMDPEGKIGVHFEEFPEQAAFNRWFDGDFSEIERFVAQGWRSALNSLDPNTTIEWVKNIVPQGRKFSNIQEVKAFADEFVQGSGLKILNFALELLNVPGGARFTIQKRYVVLGQPPLEEFAPYAAYVLKVEIFYYLCLRQSFIAKERASNKADIAYLYYLPFSMAFVSADNLHVRTAELFMEHGQRFVKAKDLKAALKDTDDYFSQYADEIEKIGVMRFTSYPPADLNNLITELWDAFMRPDWREVEDDRKKGKDGMPSDPELVKKLNRQHKESVPITPPADPDSVDFVMVTRRHRVRKGKWRVLPPEVENKTEHK